MPESVREARGDQAVRDFTMWLDDFLQEKSVPRDEYQRALSQLDVVEHDIAVVKTELRELRREMNERFDRMNEYSDTVILTTCHSFGSSGQV